MTVFACYSIFLFKWKDKIFEIMFTLHHIFAFAYNFCTVLYIGIYCIILDIE